MNIVKKKSDPVDNYHHEAGKGSVYRPSNSEQFDLNWDRIFGKKELQHDTTTNPRIQDSQESPATPS